MPLYEYRCHQCGKTFEIRQKFAEAPLTVHEGCGGGLERIIFASALQFKGTGWYVTDYARGGSKPSSTNGSNAKPESESESGSKRDSKESKSDSKESKSESKTESKPESKSENQRAASTPSPVK